MLNIGTRFQKPNESAYGRFCRFLAVNRGVDTSTSSINSELAVLGDISDREVPQGMFERAYKATLIQTRTRRASEDCRHAEGHYLKSGYRPYTHCPDCARVNYHTEIFNLPWVQICPVHKTKLTTHCPDCGGRWLLGSKLTSRECQTCGVNLTFNTWIERDRLQPSMYGSPLSSHLELKAMLNSDLFPRVRIETSIVRGGGYHIRLNSSPFLMVDAVRVFNMTPEALVPYFGHESFIKPVLRRASFELPKRASKSHDETIQERLGLRICIKELRRKTRDCFNEILGKGHQVGDCNGGDKLCILCAAWNSWVNAYSFEYNLDWHASLMNWNSEYRNMRQLRHYVKAPVLIGNIAYVDGLVVVLPIRVVWLLNINEAVQFLINLMVQLSFQKVYTDAHSEPNQKAYREMVHQLLDCSELSHPSYSAIKQDSKVTFIWKEPKLSEMLFDRLRNPASQSTLRKRIKD